MSDNDKKEPKFVMDDTAIKEAQKTQQFLSTQRSTNAAKEDDFSASALKRLSEVRRGQIKDVMDKNFSHKLGGYDNSNVGVAGIGVDVKRKEAADMRRAGIVKTADFSVVP